MKQTEHEEIKLELEGMLFTWDDEKEKINFQKHGIHFSAAAGAFLDTDAVYEFNSVDEKIGEERWDVIRWVFGNIIFLVYVDRITIGKDDIIRIISARKAEKEEVKRYVDGT